jgi:transposase-like protein
MERAKADGVSLVGPGGLLAGITRTVLESALDAALDAHLDEAGVDETTGRRGNVRNGHGTKTVQTEVGPGRCVSNPHSLRAVEQVTVGSN